jgi:Flp pilus assembly protein TadD
MRYLLGPAVLAAALAAFGASIAGRSSPPQTAQTAVRERAYRANNVGVARLEQFDYKGAERSFREALSLQPDLPLARLNLAIALLYDGRSADALIEAREAVKRLPDTPQAQYVLGLAAKAESSLEEAIAGFSRVTRLDARDAGAKVQLGQIYLQQRKYPEAVELFQDALASEPYNVTAAYNAALALTRGGQAEEGRAAMQRFESLRDAPYGVTYSQTYLGQGRYGEALASTGAEPELVSVAPPGVTFSDTTDSLTGGGGQPPAASPGGGITPADLDDDGDVDLVVTGPGPLRLLRNDGKRFAPDVRAFAAAGVTDTDGAFAGDYDNDGRADLFVLREQGHRLLRQQADGTFEDASGAARIAGVAAAAAAGALADLDHDGDLDVLLAGRALQVLRNNGDGTFADITSSAGVAGVTGPFSAVAAVDYDNRRDIDIVALGAGAPPKLLRNLRDGTFGDASAETGLAPPGSYSSLAIADVNKDGYPDLFFGRQAAAGVFAVSDGQSRFQTVPAPAESAAARLSQFVDYDNDGLLDLLTASDRALRLARNVGGNRWIDVTEDARLQVAVPGGARLQSFGVADLDGDGDRDLVVRFSTGELRVLGNGAQDRHRRALAVRLAGRVSNRSGLGAKVEIRAGSLRQVLETSSSFPAMAPADVIFGLGDRDAADVVRVLWPSGILQAETSFPETPGNRAVTISELDRKPSSCPYLFTWNGERFEFVTDFMGGGEMGSWVGPSVWNRPDPDEFVRIRGDQLRPREGKYELRITNELEEALFVDRVQLVAVDHDRGVEVFPNEGLRSGAQPPPTITASRGARPPIRAVDEHGHDVLSRISAMDRNYPDDFARLPIRGYAEPHELVLDLGDVSERAVLLLTGWTDYAFSSDNVAASQRALELHPPSLQVRDANGRWTTAIVELGFPVGRPQTVVARLEGRFLSGSREVRILTNMRIYWDQILVAPSPDDSGVWPRHMSPAAAALRWRGISAEVTPDGREPFSYDYGRVSAAVPWKMLVGRYTREGDVRPLLSSVDDRFVVSRPGDEIALSFDALPPPAAGLSRTFLLYAYGYSKEMNPRSAAPHTVGPLPFRGMTRYPYGPDEGYPTTEIHRQYLDEFNTRVVARQVPSIDAGAAR